MLYFLLFVVGLVLFAIGLAILIGPSITKKLKTDPLAWVGAKMRSLAVLLILLSPVFIFSAKFIFYAEPGYQYFMVYPNGSKDAVFNEGFHMRWFAKVQPWQKYIDVKTITDEDTPEAIAEIEGPMKPLPIRFIDQVTGTVTMTSRFQLPQDKESFIALALEFRSPENLTQNTLVPTVGEVVSNTGYMFAAQDYISGSAADFRQALEEQLTYGSYSVEKKAVYDTLLTAIDQPEEERSIKEIRTTYTVNKRVDENGKPIRLPHDITENNIHVAQVIVTNVDPEPDFKKRLEEQRNESAKRQLEQQKIKTAKDAQARIIAEGERDKAAERVAKEKEQVGQLIAIETKLKQETTNRDLAKIALETEKLKAQTVKVQADADAYKNQQLVQAGLTPQEQAIIDKEKAIGVAEQLSKIDFPSEMTIINGNGTSSKGDAGWMEMLIGAAMTKTITQPQVSTQGQR